MTAATPPASNMVSVRIVLSKSQSHNWLGADADERRCCEKVSAELARLLGELELPGRPQVELAEDRREEVAAEYGPGIEIGGESCRIDIRAARAVTNADALAAFASATLYWNRDRLVDAVAVEALLDGRSLWRNASGSVAPLADALSTLREIVRRGYPVRTVLCELEDRCTAPPCTHECREQLEMVLSDCFPSATTVFLGRHQYGVLLDDAPKARESSNEVQGLEEMIPMMRDGLFYELGVRFPALRFHRDRTLGHNQFRIQVNRVSAPPMDGLSADEYLVNETVDRLEMLKVKARPAVNPANESEAAILKDDGGVLRVCEDANLTTWGAQAFVILATSAVLRRHAEIFLTLSAVQRELAKLSLAFPSLVSAAVERYGVTRIAIVLRSLVAEEIGIRNLRRILETLLDARHPVTVDHTRYIVFLANEGGAMFAGPPASGIVAESQHLANHVRTGLRNAVSNKYTRGGQTLVVYLLDPAIEARLSDPTFLAPGERARLIGAVDSEVGALTPTAQRPVILTTFDVRRRIRCEIEREFPQQAVVSYQELPPWLNIQPIARITRK